MPNRATVVQSSFWRVWLQGRLAPFPAPNRISITYLMVKKIEQGHTGAPGSLNFYLHLHMYMYIYFPQNIYATRQKNPTRHFLIQGILLQCLDCTSNFGDLSSQEANVESWSTAASAKRPKPPQSCREPRWWIPKSPWPRWGWETENAGHCWGMLGLKHPKNNYFFWCYLWFWWWKKCIYPHTFQMTFLFFCWENDKPLDIGAPCFQTSQNLSNANQYTHTDTHTHTQTHAARAHAHTHTYCF